MSRFGGTTRSDLVPSGHSYFEDFADKASKMMSESSPTTGQVALVTALFCIGAGKKKRCFGYPVVASNEQGNKGVRELRRWAKKRGNVRTAGNEDVICEVKLVSRIRKGKRIIGVIKNCYQKNDEIVSE